jgi:hypothetical protein
VTGAGHAFRRPGQVAPDLPAPDACVICGQPGAVHLPAAERAARVTAAAAALGDFRRFEDGSALCGDWAVWSGRLAAALGSVLEVATGTAGASLHAAQLATLGHALADAAQYRQPSGACADCDVHPAGLCPPHAADLDRADDYAALARQLGVQEDPC